MTTPVAQDRIELQTGLPHHHHHGDRFGPTPHQHVGFELGWDYAHYRVTPPAPYAQEPSPLRHGLAAGQAAFGTRTLAATKHVRKWLQLRLHAWLRGRSVELVQVTPNYLAQIDVSHCPITRVELSSATLAATDASIDRVRNDAAYAAGNLAVLSTKATHAKGAHGRQAALRYVQQIDAGPLAGLGGLTAAQWARVAVLCSFVEALAHDEACALPLLVLPPNRLRLFNPVQALQAFVSRQLLEPGWSRRLSRFEDLLPGKALQRDFKAFVMALLPRVIEAGAGAGQGQAAPGRATNGPRTAPPPAARWAIEDAWRSALVQQRWVRFARQLSPAQCEALLARAVARKLCATLVVPLSDAAALDGWMLDSRGYVPHAVPPPANGERQGQQHFAW